MRPKWEWADPTESARHTCRIWAYGRAARDPPGSACRRTDRLQSLCAALSPLPYLQGTPMDITAFNPGWPGSPQRESLAPPSAWRPLAPVGWAGRGGPAPD